MSEYTNMLVKRLMLAVSSETRKVLQESDTSNSDFDRPYGKSILTNKSSDEILKKFNDKL